MDTVTEVRKLLESLQKSFQCIICLELLSQPVDTKCNHQFCSSCLKELTNKSSKKKPPACPLCNKKINKRGLNANKKLGEVVNAVRDVCNAADEDCHMLGTTPLLSQKHRRSHSKGTVDKSSRRKSLTFINHETCESLIGTVKNTKHNAESSHTLSRKDLVGTTTDILKQTKKLRLKSKHNISKGDQTTTKSGSATFISKHDFNNKSYVTSENISPEISPKTANIKSPLKDNNIPSLCQELSQIAASVSTDESATPILPYNNISVTTAIKECKNEDVLKTTLKKKESFHVENKMYDETIDDNMITSADCIFMSKNQCTNTQDNKPNSNKENLIYKDKNMEDIYHNPIQVPVNLKKHENQYIPQNDIDKGTLEVEEKNNEMLLDLSNTSSPSGNRYVKRKVILTLINSIVSPNKDLKLLGNLSFSKVPLPHRLSTHSSKTLGESYKKSSTCKPQQSFTKNNEPEPVANSLHSSTTQESSGKINLCRKKRRRNKNVNKIDCSNDDLQDKQIKTKNLTVLSNIKANPAQFDETMFNSTQNLKVKQQNSEDLIPPTPPSNKFPNRSKSYNETVINTSKVKSSRSRTLSNKRATSTKDLINMKTKFGKYSFSPSKVSCEVSKCYDNEETVAYAPENTCEPRLYNKQKNIVNNISESQRKISNVDMNVAESYNSALTENVVNLSQRKISSPEKVNNNINHTVLLISGEMSQIQENSVSIKDNGDNEEKEDCGAFSKSIIGTPQQQNVAEKNIIHDSFEGEEDCGGFSESILGTLKEDKTKHQGWSPNTKRNFKICYDMQQKGKMKNFVDDEEDHGGYSIRLPGTFKEDKTKHQGWSPNTKRNFKICYDMQQKGKMKNFVDDEEDHGASNESIIETSKEHDFTKSKNCSLANISDTKSSEPAGKSSNHKTLAKGKDYGGYSIRLPGTLKEDKTKHQGWSPNTKRNFKICYDMQQKGKMKNIVDDEEDHGASNESIIGTLKEYDFTKSKNCSLANISDTKSSEPAGKSSNHKTLAKGKDYGGFSIRLPGTLKEDKKQHQEWSPNTKRNFKICYDMQQKMKNIVDDKEDHGASNESIIETSKEHDFTINKICSLANISDTKSYEHGTKNTNHNTVQEEEDYGGFSESIMGTLKENDITKSKTWSSGELMSDDKEIEEVMCVNENLFINVKEDPVMQKSADIDDESTDNKSKEKLSKDFRRNLKEMLKSKNKPEYEKGMVDFDVLSETKMVDQINLSTIDNDIQLRTSPKEVINIDSSATPIELKLRQRSTSVKRKSSSQFNSICSNESKKFKLDENNGIDEYHSEDADSDNDLFPNIFRKETMTTTKTVEESHTSVEYNNQLSIKKLKRRNERKKLVKKIQQFVNDITNEDSSDSLSDEEKLLMQNVFATKPNVKKKRKTDVKDNEGEEACIDLIESTKTIPPIPPLSSKATSIIDKSPERTTSSIHYNNNKNTTSDITPIKSSSGQHKELSPTTPSNLRIIPIQQSTVIASIDVFKVPKLKETDLSGIKINNVQGSLIPSNTSVVKKVVNEKSNVISHTTKKTVNTGDSLKIQSPHTTTNSQGEVKITKLITKFVPVLMTSRLTKKHMQYCNGALKKLGGRYVQQMAEDVTHLLVVTDENRCLSKETYTYKYLIALVSGLWIVDFRWIVDSMKNGKFVDAEKYEAKGDASSFHEDIPKLYRQSKDKESLLFDGYRVCLLGKFQQSQIGKDQLVTLLEKTGAEVAFSLDEIHCSSSQIQTVLVTDDLLQLSLNERNVIGKFNMHCIHPEWVVESIINFKVQGSTPFILKFVEV